MVGLLPSRASSWIAFSESCNAGALRSSIGGRPDLPTPWPEGPGSGFTLACGFPWTAVPCEHLSMWEHIGFDNDQSHSQRPRRPLRGDEEASRDPMERGGPPSAREEAR